MPQTAGLMTLLFFPFIGCIAFIAYKCDLLRQMSHVAWSVCLCVDQTDVPCKNI